MNFRRMRATYFTLHSKCYVSTISETGVTLQNEALPGFRAFVNIRTPGLRRLEKCP